MITEAMTTVPAYVYVFEIRHADTIWGEVILPVRSEQTAPFTVASRLPNTQQWADVVVAPTRRLCATCWILGGCHVDHGHQGVCTS